MLLYELNPPATQNVEDVMNMAMQNNGSCSRCNFECIDRWIQDGKSAKRRDEVTIDLMKWPKWVQNAKYVKNNIIFLTQQGPTEVILEPNKAPLGQPDLDRTSVFPRRVPLFVGNM